MVVYDAGLEPVGMLMVGMGASSFGVLWYITIKSDKNQVISSWLAAVCRNIMCKNGKNAQNRKFRLFGNKKRPQ